MTATRPALLPSWHVYGTILALSLIVSMTAVKLSPGFLALFLIATFVSVRPPLGALAPAGLAEAPVFWSIVVFLLIAATSALWASNPGGSIGKALEALLLLAFIAAAQRSLIRIDKETVDYLGRDVVHAAILVCALLACDLSLGFPITGAVLSHIPASKWANNYLVQTPTGIVISKSWLSRQMSALAVLFWPLLMIAALRTSRPAGLVRMLGLGTLAVIAISVSEKDAAKVAMLTGATAWLATWYVPRFAVPAGYAAWTLCCLLIVPLLLTLSALNADRWSFVPESGRARLEIWQRMSDYVLERPMLGIGADSTLVEERLRVKREREERQRAREQKVRLPQPETPEELKFSALVRTHPHNQFLQVWYELGVVGATSFVVLGLTMIRAISRLDRLPRAYGMATMASVTALASLTHSLWQEWYVTMFAWCFVLFTIGLCLYRRQREPAGTGGKDHQERTTAST